MAVSGHPAHHLDARQQLHALCALAGPGRRLAGCRAQMRRLLTAAFGIAAYASFVAAFGMLVLSLEGILFPLDAGAGVRPWRDAAGDLGLVALFGLQHS